MDQYGAITLPIPVPAGGGRVGPATSVSDPLIDYTLAYLQAVINDKAADAWASVMLGSLPVANVRTNDPEELEFNVVDLPCLYGMRSGSAKDGPERMAADIILMRDEIHLLWVFPPARQAFQAFRSQMVAGISKTIHAAIEMGRDPSWVVRGDPDPQAATHGSNFPKYAGWSRMNFTKWSTKVIVMKGEKSLGYPALHGVLEVEEIFQEDISKYDLLDGVDVTETTEDGQVITDHAIFT